MVTTNRHLRHGGDEREAVELNPVFVRPGEASALPKHRMPDGESLPETAYQIVHDEAMLDGNARLNLATFVGTWMDEQASRLYIEAADKNIVDKDEYPQTAAIEQRCWRMLADLWNAPHPAKAIGTSTIGSSEACMLAGLALKRRWQHARKAAGKPTDKPNLVMSAAVQVCWEKFCNYFEVEARYVPITEEHPCLDGSDLEKYVDENTIGVVAIMGVTYTGMYEPVQEIAAALDALQERTGLDVPIHVDGASGAMIAPFLQPEIEWDFRLERVHSISTTYSDVMFKLVLLPVWLATFMYAGKQWQVMVNANTGEVVGERPWSVPKIVAAVLVGIVLVVLAVWFFGRNQQ